MNSYKTAYIFFFNALSDQIDSLSELLRLPNIPLDTMRKIGVAIENLKAAQTDAEERMISGDDPL